MKTLRQQILETLKQYGFKAKTLWQKTNARIYGQRIYYLSFPSEKSKRRGIEILREEDFRFTDYDKEGVLIH